MGPLTFYLRQAAALTVDTDQITLDLKDTGNSAFTDDFTGSGALYCTFTDVETNIVQYGKAVTYSAGGGSDVFTLTVPKSVQIAANTLYLVTIDANGGLSDGIEFASD